LSIEEWDRHLESIRTKIEELELLQQAQAQQAARGQNQAAPGGAGLQGNIGNTGNPVVRQQANNIRPRTNNFEG